MLKFIKLFFIFFLFSNYLYAEEKHLRVSYDPDHAPFSYLENNKPEGLLIDFWKLWAEKNDYTIDFINGRYWDNAINLVKKEKVDFFLGTSPYGNWMRGSKSYYTTKTSLFILKEYTKSFSKNASYIIGIIGNTHKEYIKKNFPNSQIVVYKNNKSIFKDFISKKIDIIYDDKVAIEFYALKNSYFHKIRSIDLLSDTSQIQAIAKNNSLISIFNEGLENINTDELYDVESKWILNEKYQVYKRSTNLTEDEKQFLKNKKIRVATKKDWKPFDFQDSSRKPAGISNEIWQLLTAKEKIKSEYTFFDNFTKQLASIKKKKSDVILGVGKTKHREKYAIFTKPFLQFPLSIVTLKDENFIENMDFLFDKRVAVGRNYTAHELLKEKYPKLNFFLVDNIEQGLEAVKDNKAYAYIDLKPTLTYNIEKLGLEELKITGNTGINFELCIMIRDDYIELKRILDKAIDTLSKEEVLTIVNKWSSLPFKDRYNYKLFWLSIGIIIFVLLILLYKNQRNIRRNKKLQQIVEERTKELKLLNKELEYRVDLKTKELTRANYLLDEAQKITKLGSFNYNIKKNLLRWSEEHFKIFDLNPNGPKPSLQSFLSFVHEDDKEYVKKEFLRSLKYKKKHSFEFRIVMKDKSIKYLQSTSKITKYDENNDPLLIIGTMLDLTKIKKLEMQKREQDSILAQQSKMAAMGEMLENIAHQWRQPLSIISTVSTGMQVQIELNGKVPDELLIENVNSINNHAQYLSKTIDDFRNFFNPNKKRIKFNIENTIEKALSLTSSRMIENHIKVIKNIETTAVSTFENELIQIFLNIINNATDALISKEIEEKYIFISTYKNEENLCIEIKDNAGGIPKKIINRIFEPYFTTKHKSQGTGIGLYMSNEIVTKHLHGNLVVKNKKFIHNEKPYKGALFTIHIPLDNNI